MLLLCILFFYFCSAVDCGILPVPLNGSIQGSVSTFPNVLEFSCDNGFTIVGSVVRKCQANATWSGRTAFCKGAYFVCLFLFVVVVVVVVVVIAVFVNCQSDTLGWWAKKEPHIEL